MRDDARSYYHFCLPKMIFTHADAQFLSSNLTVHAESVSGSTPGARVAWNTTLPPDCVTSVSVNFRTTANGRLEAINSTTNTSQTAVIQNGLQCGASYYVRVVVSGEPRCRGVPLKQFLSSHQVQVFIGGKEIVCIRFDWITWLWLLSHITAVLFRVRAEVTADNTSIRVSWKWSCQGTLDIISITVRYQPEGGSLMMYTVDNTTATSATLPNLQCNTKYTVWVLASGSRTGRRRSPSTTVSLPARGMYLWFSLLIQFTVVYHPSLSHSHWGYCSAHKCLNCQGNTAVD